MNTATQHILEHTANASRGLSATALTSLPLSTPTMPTTTTSTSTTLHSPTTYDYDPTTMTIQQQGTTTVAYYTYDAPGNSPASSSHAPSAPVTYTQAQAARLPARPLRGVATTTHHTFAPETTQYTALYYYGYRFYSSELGRWLSRDPIGESGGENLSGFVANNPANSTDFLGYFMIWLPPVAREAACRCCCPSEIDIESIVGPSMFGPEDETDRNGYPIQAFYFGHTFDVVFRTTSTGGPDLPCTWKWKETVEVPPSTTGTTRIDPGDPPYVVDGKMGADKELTKEDKPRIPGFHLYPGGSTPYGAAAAVRLLKIQLELSADLQCSCPTSTIVKQIEQRLETDSRGIGIFDDSRSYLEIGGLPWGQP